MGLFWNSLFPIISIGVVCLKVAASDIVTITEPLVVTKDEDFSSRQTTLQCSSSVQHEYCCWSIPDVGDCHCREKSCQKGVKVTSDEKVCSITIDHSQKDITIAGSWSCTLLHDVMDRRGGNATSELFVVDLNETPTINKLFENELSLATKAEYECDVSSRAPNHEIQWLLDQEVIGHSANVQLNLSREDFNKSLTCSIQHKNHQNEPIGKPLQSQLNLIMDLDPKVFNADQVDSHVYEFEAESWPRIDFLRITSNEGQFELFAYNLSCRCYTRPEHSQSWFVQDLLWTSVSSARSHFSITFKPNISTVHKTLSLEMGNAKGGTTKHVLELKNDVSIIPSIISKSSSVSYIVAAVVTIIVICIAVVLICKFKRQISEFFQCGEYQVPPDDDPLDAEEKAEKKKLPTESDF